MLEEICKVPGWSECHRKVKRGLRLHTRRLRSHRENRQWMNPILRVRILSQLPENSQLLISLIPHLNLLCRRNSQRLSKPEIKHIHTHAQQLIL